MSIALNVFYRGEKGAALAFAEEMESSGLAEAVRSEEGCEEYAYYTPYPEGGYVLLLERWSDQEAINAHMASPNMKKIAALKEKLGVATEIRKYPSGQG